MQVSYSLVLPHQRQPDRPYLDAIIEAHRFDKRVGYLRFEWVSSLLLNRILPTVWHCVNTFEGWCLGIEPESDFTDPAVIASIWQEAQKYRGWPYINRKDVPSTGEMLEELAILAEKMGFNKKFKEFKEGADYVYVGYSRVDDGTRWPEPPEFSYQKRGIGTTMYRLAAMWLAGSMNQPLHGSSLQSLSAKAAWNKMVVLGYPIYRIRRPGSNKHVLTLDYTQTPLLRERSRRATEQLATKKSLEHPTVWPLY